MSTDRISIRVRCYENMYYRQYSMRSDKLKDVYASELASTLNRNMTDELQEVINNLKRLSAVEEVGIRERSFGITIAPCYTWDEVHNDIITTIRPLLDDPNPLNIVVDEFSPRRKHPELLTDEFID